jgi:hypothetical protein
MTKPDDEPYGVTSNSLRIGLGQITFAHLLDNEAVMELHAPDFVGPGALGVAEAADDREPIGHTQGIFSVAGLLLVTRRVYSQCLVSYWSHAGYILSGLQRVVAAVLPDD